MSENTTNVEGLVFTAKDEASATAGKIAHSLERIHHTAEMARTKVGEFARSAATGALASVGLGFGLHAVYEKAKEANLAMDQVQKSVTGSLYAFQGWRKGVSEIDRMTHSMHQAEEATENLEEMELKLRVPLEALGATYNSVAVTGFSKLGMGQKEVLELTEKVTAAAKVYGTSGEEAMMKINRVLLVGRVGLRDTSGLAEKLRESLHLKKGEKLGPEELMRRMSKGLGDMVPIAQKMGENFSGNLFEAGALVEKMLEDLSRPMFKEQTKSLSEWVQKLRMVREDGKSIMQIYGEKIAGAFQTIKSATGFIVDHWKSLIAIYAASKLSGALGGMSAFAAKTSAAGVVGGLGGMGGAAGVLNVTAGVVNVGQGLGAKIGEGMTTALRPGVTSTVGQLTTLGAKAGVVAALLVEYAGMLKLAWDMGERLGEHFGDQSKGRGAAALLTSVNNLEHAIVTTRDRGKEGEASARVSMQSAFAAMGMQPGQKVTAEAVGGLIEGLPTEVATKMAAELHYLLPETVKKWRAQDIEAMPKELGMQIAAALNEWMQRFPAGEAPTPNVAKKAPRGHGDINIANLTITQDFKEADPDRVFHRVTNEIASLVNAPGKARTASSMAGGF